MRWASFLEQFGDYPVIEPAMVYAGQPNPGALQVQLSHWVASGRLIKLARGKYMIAAPYRKINPPLEHLANRIIYPSYVSFERALSWYGLIPESTPVVTSVTTQRPVVHETPLGTFRYRHVRPKLFWGFERVFLRGIEVTIALPEKALVDLFYFWSGPLSLSRIEGMRFQNLDQIDPERLSAFACRTEVRKIAQGVERLLSYREMLSNEDFS
jgi:predicted transcriptional regulator of viral defense system